MYQDRQIRGVIGKCSGNRWKKELDSVEQRMILQTWNESGRFGY